MASGASSTLTKELRIELKFVTTQFLRQTRTAARALDILNSRLGKTQASANETQDAFRQLAQETRAVGSKENTATFQENAKALREVSSSAKSAKTSLNQYNTAATKASSKSKKVSSGFSGVGKASTKARNAVQGLTAALGGFITIQSARSALNNALAFDRVENRMRAATNSTKEYNKKTKFASELADKLGVDLLAASRGFATLTAATRGSNVEGAVTDQLFESILKTSAALSLTADETNSVILAFGQVASKGRAAAEEIRGQIGERIPGFYVKLAEALGKTQGELTKLLDQGLLSSDQALKASAIALEKAFGQKALDNAQSATAQYNRIVNEVRQAGNESARWLANNSAIILSIRKIGELLAANRIARESDSDLVNNSIESTEKRIAQLEILRRQGEITDKEARKRILKAINDQEVALRGVEKTKAQLEELERVRSFINDGTFDAIEAESNLLDITNKYLKNEREVTKEKQNQLELDKQPNLIDSYLKDLEEVSKYNRDIAGSYENQLKSLQDSGKRVKEQIELIKKLGSLSDKQKIPYAEQIEDIKNLGLLDDKLKQIIESAEQIGDVKNPELLDDKLKQIIESAKQIGNIKNFGSLDDELKKIIESAEQIGDVKNLDLLDDKLKRIIESAKKIGNTKNLELLSDEVKRFIENTKVEDIKSLGFLDDKQKILYAEQIKQYALQKNADKDRLKTLQEQLKTLKEQKEALKGGTGKVNFIEAIQAGSAASIKLSIEARAQGAGAVDGNKELLQEIDLGIKKVGEEIEILNNKIKVENA